MEIQLCPYLYLTLRLIVYIGEWGVQKLQFTVGLDDFKVALYVCPNHRDDGIHPDYCYLVTVENPIMLRLNAVNLQHPENPH